MDTTGEVHIFHETNLDNKINDKLAVRPNIYFRNNNSKRNPQRGTQYSPHGMNTPHLNRTRAIRVNTQTTTATAPKGVNHPQPPLAAVRHDTSFRIVNCDRRLNKVSSHI
jgi:hypothetical protein